MITLAHRQGLSQRFLADVFDLSRAAVQKAIASTHERAGFRAESAQPGSPERTDLPRLSVPRRRRKIGHPAA